MQKGFSLELKTTPNSITSDAIYKVMRERIVTAEWQPGVRLVQRQLAKEFGASSIPVLEAIRRLESDGLVTSHPNAGAQVKGWTEDDVRSIYEARGALEGITCRLFAEQASAEDKAEAARLSRHYDEAVQAVDATKSRQLDVQFHLYIMRKYEQLARSDALRSIAQNAFLLSVTIRSVTIKNGTESEENRESTGTVGVHDPILEAFFAGDGEAAEKAIKAHVNIGRDTVLQAMRSPESFWQG